MMSESMQNILVYDYFTKEQRSTIEAGFNTLYSSTSLASNQFKCNCCVQHAEGTVIKLHSILDLMTDQNVTIHPARKHIDYSKNTFSFTILSLSILAVFVCRGE